MEITKNQITDVLIATVKIVRNCNAVDEALGTDVMLEKFGHELDLLTDTVLDLCGVPKEETPFAALGINTNGWDKSNIEYGFCRDGIKDDIYENLELAEFEHNDDLESICEATVMHLLDEWQQDEQFIFQSGE